MCFVRRALQVLSLLKHSAYAFSFDRDSLSFTYSINRPNFSPFSRSPSPPAKKRSQEKTAVSLDCPIHHLPCLDLLPFLKHLRLAAESQLSLHCRLEVLRLPRLLQQQRREHGARRRHLWQTPSARRLLHVRKDPHCHLPLVRKVARARQQFTLSNILGTSGSPIEAPTWAKEVKRTRPRRARRRRVVRNGRVPS